MEVTVLSGVINYYQGKWDWAVGIYLDSRELFGITLSTVISSGKN